MALIRAGAVGTGGTFSDIVTPTVSSGVMTAEWDYDAKAVFIFATLNGAPYLYLYDVATKQMWYASSSAVWTSFGVDNRITYSGGSSADTAKSFSLNAFSGLTVTNATVIPLTDKPNGYFS